MSKAHGPKLKVFLIIILVLVAIGATASWFYGAIKSRTIFINEWFITDDAIRGVDISNHQANVDMQKLASQNIKFVYMKATEGSTFVDNYFANNWENAKKAGLARGAYHFFSFESAGTDQAEAFIRTVGESLSGDLIPVIDVEMHGKYETNPPSRDDVVRELAAMIKVLEAKYGAKPMLYAQRDIYDLYLKDDFGDFPRWVRSIYYPAGWENGDDWYIWQYKDQGILEGYTGGEKYIDLDVLNSRKSLDDLRVK